MSEKFNKFVKELEKLCIELDVTISSSIIHRLIISDRYGDEEVFQLPGFDDDTEYGGS